MRAKLFADVAFESWEAGGEQLARDRPFAARAPADPALQGTRSRCRTQGSAGSDGVFVIAHADRKIERNCFKITSRAAYAAHAQVF